MGQSSQYIIWIDRLANEGETALSKIEVCVEDYMSELKSRVYYSIAGSSIDCRKHEVCFRGVVNDTEVPDSAIDEEQREISFDWQAMFSQFFPEEKMNNYYMKSCVGSLMIF